MRKLTLILCILLMVNACGLRLPNGNRRSTQVSRDYRTLQRESFYSIPPSTRPSWKEYKAYPPKVQVVAPKSRY